MVSNTATTPTAYLASRPPERRIEAATAAPQTKK